MDKNRKNMILKTSVNHAKKHSNNTYQITDDIRIIIDENKEGKNCFMIRDADTGAWVEKRSFYLPIKLIRTDHNIRYNNRSEMSDDEFEIFRNNIYNGRDSVGLPHRPSQAIEVRVDPKSKEIICVNGNTRVLAVQENNRDETKENVEDILAVLNQNTESGWKIDQIADNTQRKNLGLLSLARSAHELDKMGLSASQIADVLKNSKDRKIASRLLAVYRLPQELKDIIDQYRDLFKVSPFLNLFKKKDTSTVHYIEKYIMNNILKFEIGIYFSANDIESRKEDDIINSINQKISFITIDDFKNLIGILKSKNIIDEFCTKLNECYKANVTNFLKKSPKPLLEIYHHEKLDHIVEKEIFLTRVHNYTNIKDDNEQLNKYLDQIKEDLDSIEDPSFDFQIEDSTRSERQGATTANKLSENETHGQTIDMKYKMFEIWFRSQAGQLQKKFELSEDLSSRILIEVFSSFDPEHKFLTKGWRNATKKFIDNFD